MEARTTAALMSGITLANAGLGVVHGIAAVLGGRFNIPHGVACGTLIGSAAAANINKLKKEDNIGALEKYAGIGRLISGRTCDGVEESCDALINKTAAWVEELELPRLSAYGISREDIEAVAEKSSNKSSPARLDKEDISEMLLSRL
jgi:alcohol dehydrogenase class IV